MRSGLRCDTHLWQDCPICAEHSGFPSDHPGDHRCFRESALQGPRCRVEVPLREKVELFNSELPLCITSLFRQNPVKR